MKLIHFILTSFFGMDFLHFLADLENSYFRTILDDKQRIFASKENVGKENSLQRKGCKESKEKYSLKIAIFGKIFP